MSVVVIGDARYPRCAPRVEERTLPESRRKRWIVPEILRSATLTIEQGIDLPMSPPVVVVGRGTDGKPVCHLYINATGVSITGPKGGELRNLNWDELVELVKS
jgi:hypothetical protein